MVEFITVAGPSSGEIEEKKSRFIARLIPCETEEAANAFIENSKKQFWDARHNCYAYILGERGDVVKCSDDGEPQKTAGQPILSVLQGAELTNVCCVVTRYFGGTLLGTGGLIRAYTDSTKAAVDAACRIKKQPGYLLKIDTDYTDLGKIQYLLNTENVEIVSTDYAEGVCISVEVEVTKADTIISKIVDATSARAKITKASEIVMDVEI
ncbi:MAG: YigZ family protein [Lachnospiraceae bacterium]|nr:YigZ family protein [Lachnospiraceae bacterium]